MITVGLDVHVRNSYVHATDAAGQVLCRGRLENTRSGLGAMLEPVAQQAKAGVEPVRVVLETTTNARAIQRMLLEYGREAGLNLTASVLDARKLRVIAESVSKCDALDAKVLNELARADLRLPVCYLPDDAEFALREHLRARSDLVRMRTMLKNRVHAVLHRRNILSPKADLFTGAGRMFLAQLSLDEAGRTILERYLSMLESAGSVIDESNASLRALAREPRWAKPTALLQTMPGVGLIIGMTIQAELGDVRRFASRAAVANYAGLVPVMRHSNNKQFSGGITHRGSTHLRAVLTEGAWMAIPRVPVYGALFERVALKKGKATAVVAVARRMLEDAYTMLRKDEAFRYVSVPACVGPAGESRSGRQAASSVAG